MQKKWKIILGGALAVIVLAVIFLQRGMALEADLLEVQPQTILRSFKEEGRILPEVERPIYALYGKELLKLYVREGQRVQKGDLLAVLNSQELALQLRQLEGQLASLRGEEEKALKEEQGFSVKNQELLVEQARMDLETARVNLERVEKIFETGGASLLEYEEAQSAFKKAAINLKLQEEALALLMQSYSPEGATREFYRGRREALLAQIEMLRHQIEACSLTAPLEGIVANITVKEGELPAPGVPLMSVFQEDSYAVEVYLLAEEAQFIYEGMEAALIIDRRAAAPEEGYMLPCVVKSVSPTAVETLSPLGLAEQRVKVLVALPPGLLKGAPEMEPGANTKTEAGAEAKAEAERKNLRFFPGARVDVEFTLERLENQLVVPKTALFPYGGKEALWVVKNGKAQIQPVEKGFENDREVAIAAGLRAGDLVILNPRLSGLKEGQKIRGR